MEAVAPVVGAWPAMPREAAWLLKREGYHVSSITNALHALLHDPEVMRLLAEARTAMRLVRPLARMLGVPVPAPLRLARRPVVRKSRPENLEGLAWPERSPPARGAVWSACEDARARFSGPVAGAGAPHA